MPACVSDRSSSENHLGGSFSFPLPFYYQSVRRHSSPSLNPPVVLESRKEGKMEGRKEGKMEGRKEGRKEERKEGKMEGRKEGRKDGRKEKKTGRKVGRIGPLGWPVLAHEPHV